MVMYPKALPTLLMLVKSSLDLNFRLIHYLIHYLAIMAYFI